MDDWIFIAVFHNLSINKQIENKYVLVTRHDDPITENIRKRSPAFSQFVDNFKDQFGRPFSPCLLFLHKKVAPDLEAIIAFRNILAISSIVQSWERFICHGTQLDYYKFSNYFDLYPYSLSKDEEDLIANTPSILGLDEPSEFQGQCSPEIATAYATSNFYDPYLFEALFNEWIKYFVKRKRKDWASIALFRSLEMAFRAAGLPFRNQGTLHDYGANIALWISAFEILTHPGNEFINVLKIIDFLGEIDFRSKKLNHRRYKGRKNERLNIVQKTYLEMHVARNQFLHGNPVNTRGLFPDKKLRYNSLTVIAPVIYKCALYHFLGLFDFNSEIISEIVKDNLKRRDLEAALLKIREPRRNYRRKRKHRASPDSESFRCR